MITKLFCVYDSAVEAYFKPEHFLTKGEALRVFIDVVNDGKSNLFKHPEYYTLFEVGEFDDSTGKLLSYDAFISHGNAVEYSKRLTQPQTSEPAVSMVKSDIDKSKMASVK
ncbi:MAG: nonstructural protein [Arizlama microvirus]|nr:MAG: nonstructural protein [Arizlama microvirus]